MVVSKCTQLVHHRSTSFRCYLVIGLVCIGCTYEVWLVCLGEELFQELGPEFVEHLLQVDVGASVVMPQVCIQVREDLGVLGVHSTPGGGEELL